MTLLPEGSTDVSPLRVAVTVPPVGPPSILLRGGAVIVTVVDGSSPLRLSGDVVGTRATHRPDSYPFLAAVSTRSVTIVWIIRPR